MPKAPITKKEQDVYSYILGYISDNGYSPTREEIGAKFGISPPGANRFVKSLVDKGKLELIQQEGKRINRNIRLKLN